MRTHLLLSLVPLAVPLLLAGCSGNAQQPPSPSTVAHDAHVSGEIVAAAGSIFWVDRGASVVDSIRAMPTSGASAATTIYSAPADTSPAIEDLASDGTSLYWLEVSLVAGRYHSQVKAMPVNGGPTRVLADADTALFLVAVNGAYVYFSEVDSLERVPVGGGAVEKVTSSSAIASWAVAATSAGACWAAPGDGTVSCEPAGASAPVTVATRQSNVQVVAIAGSTVYWSTVDEPEHPAHASVLAAPMAGGPSRTLTSDVTDVVALAADGSAVYFIDQTATSAMLQKIGTDGSGLTTLAGGFSPADPTMVSAVHIALGDTSVYWTDATQGLVLSVAK